MKGRTAQKENLLKWMGEKGVKPYTLNAINEKLEQIEPELNTSKYELMKLKEMLERRFTLACSSQKIARDILRSLTSFADFSFGEKKRLLCEVIHKIKVDSKNEVHLFLKQPPQISLGLTVPSGSLHQEKTQSANYFYKIKFSLIEYYNKK